MSKKNGPSIYSPPYGMFSITFNNRKKHGRYHIRSLTCEGTLYSNGHVNLNTSELPVRDFLSLNGMNEYLGSWGDYEITWLEGVRT